MRAPCLLALAGLVAACSGAVGDTSTSATTTTTIPASTSSTAPSTTSAPTTEPTTTTLATTTTARPTTTDVALVVAAEGVLGWWDGAAWVDIDGLDPSIPATGGETYQVLGVGRSTTTAVGSEPLDLCRELAWFVALEPDPFAYDPFAPGVVAVSAPWDVAPGPYDELPGSPNYSTIAAELLASRGIDDPDPQIVQLLRTDLDGDGADEIFAVVERRTGQDGGLIPANPGDYSIAFVRVVLDGDVQTAILGEFVVEPSEVFTPNLAVFRISAFADVDGDGTDEVAVQSSYYEGSATMLWDWQGPDLGFVPVLGVGCGA